MANKDNSTNLQHLFVSSKPSNIFRHPNYCSLMIFTCFSFEYANIDSLTLGLVIQQLFFTSKKVIFRSECAILAKKIARVNNLSVINQTFVMGCYTPKKEKLSN